MKWKKCLYLNQNYPANYIEIKNKTILRKPYESIYDINRLILRISCVVFCFGFYLMILNSNDNNLSARNTDTIISIFLSDIYFIDSKGSVSIKPGIVLLLFGYLMVKVVQKFASELSSSQIYIFFLFSQILFVIDSVRSSIYNNAKPQIIPDPLKILSLEESINIPKNHKKNQILGYTSCFAGFIFLSSRFKLDGHVFELFCLYIITYILLPIYYERKKFYRNARNVVYFYFFVSLICIYVDIRLFVLYSCVITYVYFVSYISIKFMEKNITDEIKSRQSIIKIGNAS